MARPTRQGVTAHLLAVCLSRVPAAAVVAVQQPRLASLAVAGPATPLFVALAAAAAAAALAATQFLVEAVTAGP